MKKSRAILVGFEIVSVVVNVRKRSFLCPGRHIQKDAAQCRTTHNDPMLGFKAGSQVGLCAPLRAARLSSSLRHVTPHCNGGILLQLGQSIRMSVPASVTPRVAFCNLCASSVCLELLVAQNLQSITELLL